MPRHLQGATPCVTVAHETSVQTPRPLRIPCFTIHVLFADHRYSNLAEEVNRCFQAAGRVSRPAPIRGRIPPAVFKARNFTPCYLRNIDALQFASDEKVQKACEGGTREDAHLYPLYALHSGRQVQSSLLTPDAGQTMPCRRRRCCCGGVWPLFCMPWKRAF